MNTQVIGVAAKRTLIGGVALLVGLAAPARAANSIQTMNIQGVLRDGTGSLQSMAVGLIVNLYPSQSATQFFYTQNFPSVPIDNGFFSVELSDAKLSFSAYPEAWVGIQVAGDPTELPRQHLGAAPYAMVCDNAVGDITPNSVTVNGHTVIDSSGSLATNIPYAYAYSETSQTTTTRNAWVSATGFSVTAPRDGTYLIQAATRAFCLQSGDSWWKSAIYNVTSGTRIATALGLGVATGYGACPGDSTVPITAVAPLKANDVITLQFWITGSATGAVSFLGDSNGGVSITLLRIAN